MARTTARARCGSPGARRVDRGGLDRRPDASSCTTAGAAWSEMAVLCRTTRLFVLLQQAFGERGVPVEIVGLAGLLKMPEVVEVLAYARAVHDPTASVALARILLGPRYRVGFKDLALLAWLASARPSSCARLRHEDDDVEAEPFLFAEALEHLDEVEGLSEDGRARLEEFREELARAARRGATPGGRVPRRGDPADRDPRRARRRPRPASRARRAAQPRGVPRRGPRVRAGRGRAHAARVPRLHRRGRAARQAGVVAGAAVRRGLGQGDDDPRAEGPGVRPRVRARVRARACCRTRRSSRTPPSAASRWTSSCAATPTSCRASTATCRSSRRRCRRRR